MAASSLLVCKDFFVPQKGFLRKSLENLLFGYKDIPQDSLTGKPMRSSLMYCVAAEAKHGYLALLSGIRTHEITLVAQITKKLRMHTGEGLPKTTIWDFRGLY